MERSMFSIKRTDRIRTQKIKQKLILNIDMVRYIRRLKWSSTGHISRLRNDRWTYLDSFWQPSEGKRIIKNYFKYMLSFHNSITLF